MISDNVVGNGFRVDRSQDNLIRLPEVRRRTGLSAATIYRMIERGEFPTRVRLSVNAVAWYESEVSRWVADPTGWPVAV